MRTSPTMNVLPIFSATSIVRESNYLSNHLFIHLNLLPLSRITTPNCCIIVICILQHFTNIPYIYINDIATIHVPNVDRNIFEENQIYPGCLPKLNTNQQSRAIHAGWSSPPPLKYLQENAPFHFPYFRDFSKRWHYRMDM